MFLFHLGKMIFHLKHPSNLVLTPTDRFYELLWENKERHCPEPGLRAFGRSWGVEKLFNFSALHLWTYVLPIWSILEGQGLVNEMSCSLFWNKTPQRDGKESQCTGYQTLLYIGVNWGSFKNSDIQLSLLRHFYFTGRGGDLGIGIRSVLKTSVD